jgi:hypothetical protein
VRHKNERREENNNNNKTMDDNDYDDDEQIEYNEDAARVARYPVQASDTIRVQEISDVFFARIIDTIETNQVSPLSEIHFNCWKESIGEVFTQVKTGFGPNAYNKSVDK